MSTSQPPGASVAPSWAHSLGMFLISAVVLSCFGYWVLDRSPTRAVVIASLIALAITGLERREARRRARREQASTSRPSAASVAPGWAHSLGMFLISAVVISCFGYWVLDQSLREAVVLASVVALGTTALERREAQRRARAARPEQIHA